MKRFVATLLACLLLAVPALAEITLTQTPVGVQVINGDYDVHILRVDFAGGEKEIPSVYVLTEGSWMPAAPEEELCHLQDVNFDGHDDLVVLTMLGASNACHTFYLWNPDANAFEFYGGEEMWNYQLYPAQRLVVSRGTSGWAGLLHETRVYGWDESGKELKLLRSSIWDTLSETTFDSAGEYIQYTERHDDATLVETYTDYEKGTDVSYSFPSKQYQEDERFMADRFLFEDDFLGLEITQETGDDGSNG